MKKPIPDHILKYYCKCEMCGAPTQINHLSKMDKQMQMMMQLLFKLKEGWVVRCTKCENLGIVNL